MIRDDSIKFYYSFVIQACARRLFTDRQNCIVGVGKIFLAKITKKGLNRKRKKISGRAQRLCGPYVHALRWSFEKIMGSH